MLLCSVVVSCGNVVSWLILLVVFLSGFDVSSVMLMCVGCSFVFMKVVVLWLMCCVVVLVCCSISVLLCEFLCYSNML